MIPRILRCKVRQQDDAADDRQQCHCREHDGGDNVLATLPKL
jgi:hypothetical protein